MKRVQIGKISVDSGQILIIDPSYVFRDSVREEIDGGGKGPAGKSGMYSPTKWTQLGKDWGRSVIFCTGDDGIFPIIGILDDNGALVRLEIPLPGRKPRRKKKVANGESAAGVS